MMQPDKRPYHLVDPKGADEMQWFVLQDALLTDICSPLLAPDIAITPSRILDLACGPGIWAMRVAKAYPQTQVTGIDINQSMIDYAHLNAEGECITNVSFQHADYSQLDQTFSPTQFDFVNARLILWSIGPEKGDLVRHWGTVVKPGGIMRLTDWEASTTNSPSFGLLTQYLMQALHTSKRSDSAYRIGIVYQLAPLLQQAGFAQIVTIPHYVDFSAGTRFHDSYIQDIIQGAVAMEQFIVRSGVVSRETYRECMRQSIKEIDHPDFLGGHFFLSVLGVKDAGIADSAFHPVDTSRR